MKEVSSHFVSFILLIQQLLTVGFHFTVCTHLNCSPHRFVYFINIYGDYAMVCSVRLPFTKLFIYTKTENEKCIYFSSSFAFQSFKNTLIHIITNTPSEHHIQMFYMHIANSIRIYGELVLFAFAKIIVYANVSSKRQRIFVFVLNVYCEKKLLYAFGICF